MGQWDRTWKKCRMGQGLKRGKRQYETEWYKHNNWDDNSTSQKILNWKNSEPDRV